VLLLVAAAAVVASLTDAAAVAKDDELRQLLVKLKAKLGSPASDADEDEDIVIVRSAESAAHPAARDGGGADQAAAPPAAASSGSNDPRPGIAENITKLVISLLEDSLKLIVSLDQDDGAKRHHDDKSASESTDESISNDESQDDEKDGDEHRTMKTPTEDSDDTDSDDSELDASEADRPPKHPVGHHRGASKKKSVRVSGGRSRRDTAGRAGDNADADDDEDDGGSPIVKKMLKTVIELQYNLIGFDLITMYPSGSRNLVQRKVVTKKASDVDHVVDIMAQLNKLQKQI
jgi:hypothetical protein